MMMEIRIHIDVRVPDDITIDVLDDIGARLFYAAGPLLPPGSEVIETGIGEVIGYLPHFVDRDALKLPELFERRPGRHT